MAPSDGELARFAGRLRVLTFDELKAAGLSRKAIRHRVDQGRLQEWCTGVYMVGPAPPHPLSQAQAAIKSCTGKAWISHAWTHYVLGYGPVPSLPVDVTVTSGSRRGRPGKVYVHHSYLLEDRDVTTRHGIPVTTAARAILDEAATKSIVELEALKADAEVAKVLTEPQLRDVVGRAGRHRGVAKLLRLLDETNGLTRSEAERILRRLLQAAGLPQPHTDYPIGRFKADFAWPALKLIVEFDSYKHHDHRRAFRHDKRRTAWLSSQGWTVLPITSDLLRNEPFAVVAMISGAIAHASA
jgi:very-short-patch-repair endonuclease